LAVFLARGTRLFLPTLIPFLGSLVLTLAQLATDNDTLALLFPWRVSAFLVPVATAIVLTSVVVKLGPWLERFALVHRALFVGTCALLIGGACAGGLAIAVFELGYGPSRDELAMLDFVREHHRPGAVYLVPVELPKASSAARGVFSSNFTPAPRAGKAGDFIAIDLQRFRLATGAPLYVDFKAIPYKDDEVLEWYRRILWCAQVYGRRHDDGQEFRAELAGKGITHVVTPTATAVSFASLGAPLYQDEAYCIFPVRQ
jgi:hypothetical protein